MKLYIATVFLVSVILSTHGSENKTCDCKRIGGLFLVCDEKKNATDAQSYCRDRCNGNLTSIKSQQEFEILEGTIGKKRNCTKTGGKSEDAFYIGARDDVIEGEWRWIDDDSLLNETYSNWRTKSDRPCHNQPDGQNWCEGKEVPPTDQDYAVLQMCDGETYGTWFDVIGNITRPFICKTGQVPVTEPDESATPIQNITTAHTVPTMAEGVQSTEIGVSRTHMQNGTTVSTTHTVAEGVQSTDIGVNQTPLATHKPTPNSTTTTSRPSVEVARSHQTARSKHHVTPKHHSTQSIILTKPRKMQRSRGLDDHLRMLRCMLISLQKPSRMRNISMQENSCDKPNPQDDYRSPILRFEENISRSAADIMFARRLSKSVNVSVEGIRLDLVWSEVADRSSESLVMTMQHGCHECDKIEIPYSKPFVSDMVALGAKFERSVLEGMGVYDASLEDDGDTQQTNYRDIAYVSETTSVLSVTLFKKTRNEESQKESIATRTHFNIEEDDSVNKVTLNGKRSRLYSLERKCVFMKKNGDWSDHGCALHSYSPYSIECRCNHTTAFAVMVSLKAIEIPEWLETLLLCAEIIGILFLGMTLAMLMYLKQTLKKGRVMTQLQLCLALFLMHFTMVCANYATPIDELCVTLTAFSHFFVVSSAVWMLNEGVVLYKKTSSGALNFDIYKIKKWLIFFGWMVPFFYASLCLGIGMSLGVYIDKSVQYEDLESRSLENTTDVPKYSMCWLGTEYKMILAAMIPLVITLLLVICILIWVSKKIWHMNQQALDMMPAGQRRNHQSLKSTTRAIAILIPVLGIPWVLAFLVNIPGAEVVFITIHGIANGLQGVILFIIYIIVNRETRTSMKRRLTRQSFSSGNTHSLSNNATGIPHKSKKSKQKKHKTVEINPSPTATTGLKKELDFSSTKA